ncbi:Aste57867_4359 [Aphanomyces stellatus]|uniref:Aste57867_4359 protein n=1 Tax=Aphanomyces stellatus TaxID=120398 RepID=A0A485KFS8_9STRA|nr:hypothetical protein As57867_004347 [Aphanomyces stellatus]VFT81473.1 Aste57867_4359 [Aphanomyces stellatus]
MAPKRKREEAAGIVAAWDLFWEAMEDSVHETMGHERSAIFTSETKEDDSMVVERALSLQSPDAAMRDLTELLNDPMELQHMLTSFDEKDSFMRILLRQESIQTPLITQLLALLHVIAARIDQEAAMIGDKSTMTPTGMCSLILRHIRWIECIYEPSELVEVLINTVTSYPMFLQKDIIHIMPELVTDDQFQSAVDMLLDIVRSESELVVPAIDALSNFNMPIEVSDNVTDAIIERLVSSPLGDMPALVRFLVQTATADNANLILNELREKLSECIFKHAASSADETILLQQFVQGMSFRADLLAVFLKLVGKPKAKHHLLDIWALIGFHSLAPVQAKAETIFLKKVTNGSFNKEMLHDAIAAHLGGLRPYVKSLIHLSGALLQASDLHARHMGQFVFEILFGEISKASDYMYDHQSQIVSNLIGYAMSTSTASVDGALDTLLALAKQSARELDKFLPMFKQLLDSIENYDVEQSRHVYQLLCRVGGSSDPDIAITVRKQLYHQDNHYRKLGLLGAICCIEEDAAGEMFASMVLDESENPERDHFERKVRDRLDVLKDACRHQAKLLAFLYAELNHFVNRMPANVSVITIIDDKYTDELMSKFLAEFDTATQQDGRFKEIVFQGAFRTDLWATTRLNAPVYLKLMALVATPATQEYPIYLCNLLKLVVSCCKRTHATVDPIGSVLVCPIQLMEKTAIADLGTYETDAQDAIFVCLWYAINWCRELLNCFGHDASLAVTVMLRLENVVEFETILESALSNAPSNHWIPPMGIDASIPPEAAKIDGKGKGKAKVVGSGTMQQRWKAIRRTFAPLHPTVIDILPNKKDSIDPSSLTFLLDHFLTLLRTSLAKTYSTTPHWASKSASSQRSKPPLVHAPHADTDGFAMFDNFLKFQLLTVADNIRWALLGAAHHPALVTQTLCMKYIQCVVVVAKSDAFRQQNQPFLQFKSLQQLILPADQHDPVEDVRDAGASVQVMMDSLIAIQQTVTEDIDMAVQFVGALVALEALSVTWTGKAKKALLFSPAKDESQLSTLALKYLGRNWPQDKTKPSDLGVFLNAYFDHASHPLDSIRQVALHGFRDLLAHFRDGQSTIFPTLTKKTAGVYMRACFETLVRVTSHLEMDGKNTVVFLLHYLLEASVLFKFLVGLTKSFQTGAVVATVLKHSGGYINNILRTMPYFRVQFRHESKRIMKILNHIQGGTRKLQALCAHGKSTQDASAAAQVPKLKKLLERLIYESGKLARENNVMDAFTTGVLKQRNLDGSAVPVERDESPDEASDAAASDSDAPSTNDEAEHESD